MELKDAIEQEKEKIAGVLKTIGYTMSGSISVSAYEDKEMFISITIRRE